MHTFDKNLLSNRIRKEERYDAGDFLLEGQSNTVSGVAFKIQLKA